MDAFELSGLDAGTGQPKGVGVVFAQVATVRIEVGVFKGSQVEVIKEAAPWYELGCERVHFGVAGRAIVIALCHGQVFLSDQLEVGRGRVGR